MKNAFLLTLLLYLNTGFATPSADRGTGSPTPAAGSPFPLQLETRVPFAPTAFPSGRRICVVYELYITNFSASAVTLHRIDVLDAQDSSSKSVATFEGEQLDALLQPVGAQASVGRSDLRQLNAGATIVAFMWIPFENEARVPGRLRHRLATIDSSIEGAHPPVPHLHFEVTTSATLLAGEGIPYLIDHYRIRSGNNAWETRTHELPLRDMLVDFGQGGGGAN